MFVRTFTLATSLVAVAGYQYFHITHDDLWCIGVNISVALCESDDALAFKYVHTDAFDLLETMDGDCLSVQGTSNGDHVELTECNSSDPKQHWEIQWNDPDGHIYHKSLHGEKNKCLDDGVPPCMNDCHGGRQSQRWHVRGVCIPGNVTGFWNPIAIMYPGVSANWCQGYSTLDSTTNTTAHLTGTVRTASKGFKMEGGKSEGQSVSHIEAKEVVRSMTKEFGTTVQECITIDGGADPSFYGMQMWQWQMEIADTCGSVDTVQSHYLAYTEDTSTQPCCLPGMKEGTDLSYQHCLKNSDGTETNVCKSAVEEMVV